MPVMISRIMVRRRCWSGSVTSASDDGAEAGLLLDGEFGPRGDEFFGGRGMGVTVAVHGLPPCLSFEGLWTPANGRWRGFAFTLCVR